jgi:hypothetical protein
MYERYAGEWSDFPKDPEQYDVKSSGARIKVMENADFWTKDTRS